MVISLQEVINGDISDLIHNSISRFSCRDNDVESFLKSKAFDFEIRNKSRTYLIIENAGLIGYFTLSMKALQFSPDVSKNIVKSIDGFSKDSSAVGIILIGQFGKDKVLAKDIDGSKLFDICIDVIYQAQTIVGGRFVMLECQDIESVISFYKRKGFMFLQYDERDKYLQMVRRL